MLVGFAFRWNEALLLGAIVAPTDAAAVFSILHGSGVQLKKRIAATLELESGLNDPLAVALTIVATQTLRDHHAVTVSALAIAAISLIVGALAGLALGYGGRVLLLHSHLPVGGLYPIMTIAIALLAYGLAVLVRGSGFLAVYIAAAIVGNGPLPYRAGILRVHDAAAWLCQIVLYLLLGSLVGPSELIALAPEGIALGLFLAFLARPISVTLCLFPFRYSFREILYVGWVGLRGAVPIVLAMYPVLLRTEGARQIFNIVFFIVVVNTLIPGATVRWLTDWLGFKSAERTPPPAFA